MPRILKANNIANRFKALEEKQRASGTSKKTDTLAEVVKFFGSKLGDVPVGDGMAFKVPNGTEANKYLAQARGKLTAIRREGEPWAGRNYRIGIESGELILMRLPDGEALAKKTGGRPRGSGTAAGTPTPTPAPANDGGTQLSGGTVKDLTAQK